MSDADIREALSTVRDAAYFENDPRRAVRLGIACFWSAAPDLTQRASELLGWASDLGGPDLAWEIADAVVVEATSMHPDGWRDADNVHAVVDSWARAIRADFPDDGAITCAPDTCAPMIGPDIYTVTLDMSVGVAAADGEAVHAALAAASERFYLVDEFGEELEADEVNGQVFTVPYVSGIQESPGVLGVVIDTQGAPYPLMVRTMLKVLAEELRVAGAVPARIAPLP